MSTSQVNNRKIAKNTILLYIRTFVILVISLYTSRIVLKELGVEDYGVYQVVGGFVAMFAVVSSTLSSAISRFITFEIGSGDTEKLKRIFSTSVNVQIIIAVIIAVLAEIVGAWFMGHKMQIPEGREIAAKWVLHCSVFSFCINLISIPYNACIIAHEHMKAFAYFGLFEAVMKLGICFLIVVSPIDRLIWYALLLACLSLILRLLYGIYSRKHFEEAKYHFVYDKAIFKEMAGFAGWNFFSNTVYIFNTQGVNMLINVYFGVALNAARGIASQVDGAVLQFANGFTTAINPQITKSYAAGEYKPMFKLICRGARFSYYLLLLFAIPIILETEQILNLWLVEVPEHTVAFVRLVLLCTIVTMLGNTGTTACLATGKIRNYVLWISLVGLLAFPLAWVCFALGMPPEMAYVMYLLTYILVDIVRLFLMRRLLEFPIRMFVTDVIMRILPVTLVSIIIPSVMVCFIPQSLGRLVSVVFVSMLCTAVSVFYLGMNNGERKTVTMKIKEKVCR